MENNEKIVVLKGNVIDGVGDNILENGVIVLKGERIEEVGLEGEVNIPAGAEVIEFENHTLMPGLIDCHQHLSGNNVLTFNNYRVAMFEVTPQLLQMYNLLHAQMTFEMGFTTLRDLGWITYEGPDIKQLVAVRDAINFNMFAGPRLQVAGWATITNSHLDVILPKNIDRPADMHADGPYALRKLVRQKLMMGADWIKTSASGGGGTDKEHVGVKNMTQEELDAIVDEAHAFDKPVSCHCFTPEAQKSAVKAGVDTIEHCVFTDEEAMDMIKDAGIPIIPTLAHRSDRAIAARERVGTPKFVIDKMKDIQPYTKETFQRLYEKGIKIAMGTDTQIDPERGQNAMELEIYVNYGMKPMDAIKTATKNAAEAIGLDKITGTLEKGKYADIIAVEGNPLEDISIFQKKDLIKMVMKEGKIYVDRRPGVNKYVIHNGEWNWEIPV